MLAQLRATPGVCGRPPPSRLPGRVAGLAHWFEPVTGEGKAGATAPAPSLGDWLVPMGSLGGTPFALHSATPLTRPACSCAAGCFLVGVAGGLFSTVDASRSQWGPARLAVCLALGWLLPGRACGGVGRWRPPRCLACLVCPPPIPGGPRLAGWPVGWYWRPGPPGPARGSSLIRRGSCPTCFVFWPLGLCPGGNSVRTPPGFTAWGRADRSPDNLWAL